MFVGARVKGSAPNCSERVQQFLGSCNKLRVLLFFSKTCKSVVARFKHEAEATVLVRYSYD